VQLAETKGNEPSVQNNIQVAIFGFGHINEDELAENLSKIAGKRVSLTHSSSLLLHMGFAGHDNCMNNQAVVAPISVDMDGVSLALSDVDHCGH
jgi:hypothetical protein